MPPANMSDRLVLSGRRRRHSTPLGADVQSRARARHYCRENHSPASRLSYGKLHDTPLDLTFINAYSPTNVLGNARGPDMYPSLGSPHLLPLCPSARSDMKFGVVFGVVAGTPASASVQYLAEPQPVSAELMALSYPVAPTEVFRIAAPCSASKCKNFTGGTCNLAQRMIEHLPETEGELPSCRIRGACKWWQQEGEAACRRCPQIVTECHGPSKIMQLLVPSTDGVN
jgi:hypothetical protein